MLGWVPPLEVGPILEVSPTWEVAPPLEVVYVWGWSPPLEVVMARSVVWLVLGVKYMRLILGSKIQKGCIVWHSTRVVVVCFEWGIIDGA